MADTVDTNNIFTGSRRVVRRYTNVCDGTGESAVVKLDVSTLIGPDGRTAPTTCGIEWIQWSIKGFTLVSLFWDATTDDEIAKLTGNGYSEYGGKGSYLVDPRSTGFTGDVILTTAGNVSGDTYDITVGYILVA